MKTLEKYYRKEDLQDMDVIDSNGMKIGVVSDIEFTLNGKISLIVDSNGKEKKIPLTAIKALGDLIILKEEKIVEKAVR
ncbi:MAG: PRC-barrel domain-containing protein [Candidatus Bathyarchaeia archaeon]